MVKVEIYSPKSTEDSAELTKACLRRDAPLLLLQDPRVAWSRGDVCLLCQTDNS